MRIKLHTGYTGARRQDPHMVPHVVVPPMINWLIENLESAQDIEYVDLISQFINVGAIKSLIFGCKQVFRKYLLFAVFFHFKKVRF